MSYELLTDFFPQLISLQDTRPLLAKAQSEIFPASVQQRCPVPVLQLHEGVVLKWPTVAAACGIGVVMGLCLGLKALKLQRTQTVTWIWPWAMAFLWYALMSVGGFFYHSVAHMPIFYALDIIGTASSSLSAIAGCLAYSFEGYRHAHLIKHAVAVLYVVVAGMAVLGPQWVKEALYLVPSAIAFPAACWFLLKVNFCGDGSEVRKGVHLWSGVAVFGGAVALGGAVADRWTCHIFGANFTMLFFFFWGCGIGIYSFFPIVSLLVSMPSSPSRKRK